MWFIILPFRIALSMWATLEGHTMSRLLPEFENAREVPLSEVLSIEQEIECPSCRDIMTLCSDFDRICYLREECNFPFYLN